MVSPAEARKALEDARRAAQDAIKNNDPEMRRQIAEFRDSVLVPPEEAHALMESLALEDEEAVSKQREKARAKGKVRQKEDVKEDSESLEVYLRATFDVVYRINSSMQKTLLHKSEENVKENEAKRYTTDIICWQKEIGSRMKEIHRREEIVTRNRANRMEEMLRGDWVGRREEISTTDLVDRRRDNGVREMESLLCATNRLLNNELSSMGYMPADTPNIHEVSEPQRAKLVAWNMQQAISWKVNYIEKSASGENVGHSTPIKRKEQADSPSRGLPSRGSPSQCPPSRGPPSRGPPARGSPSRFF